VFVSTLAIVGHAYGVSALYEVRPYSSMAVHTALAFFILSLSLMAADPMNGIARIATSDTAGGLVCRRLLSTIPLILFAFGWVCLAGHRSGLYGTEFGLALMVLLGITVCVVAVASTAATLHKVDVTRKRADLELATLNAELEQRVEERTQQLAQLSTELSAANRSLEQLSLHDGLTSLANRRFFDTYLAGQVAIAHRQKRTLALVMCDVDAFKAYNDHYGHQAGDESLKHVAAALQSCCRRPADMVARYGGEEFAIILPDTELAAAARIAEAARSAVARLNIAHAYSPAASFVSISGGVAVLLGKGDLTPQELIAAADQSLFEAKHSGRNRMVSAPAAAA
jgi:diguanylate cyclase (GGDEF)-like protein